MNLRNSTTTLLAVAALGAAGCGDDENESATGGQTPVATETGQTPPETEPAADLGDVDELAAKISDDVQAKPEIPKPSGNPPDQLVTETIVEGDGQTAESGDTLTVQYVGVSYSTGEQFDASFDRGEPFEFQLGAGMVIPGWDEGMEGMKVGGRRLLVIPPELGYGAQGAPPAIGPNETLVFVIDLVEIS